MLKNIKNSHILIKGPTQTGKTTQAIEWLHKKIKTVPTHQILIIVPQRTLGDIYHSAIQLSNQPYANIPILTFGGLSRRMVNLFWTDIAKQAGFKNPKAPPVFLTTETAQYYMAKVVKPMLENRRFAGLTLDHNRIYSQILDNLNKTAIFDYPHTEIYEKLKPASLNDTEKLLIFQDTQTAASNFRTYCYENNLLDYSLQVELFNKFLWQEGSHCQNYLIQTYQHLLLENVEEDTYLAHKISKDWIKQSKSALVIFDTDGGYRKFLGADIKSVALVEQACDQIITTKTDPTLKPKSLNSFKNDFNIVLAGKEYDFAPEKISLTERKQHIVFESSPLYPQMLDKCVANVKALIDSGVAPSEIVLLVPFLSDALRFAIEEKLNNLNIPTKTHRPSRSLQDESIIRCLLTFAALAHPTWEIHPTQRDITTTLYQSVQQIDPTRAHIIAKKFNVSDIQLLPFEDYSATDQTRITDRIGERYSQITQWLEKYKASEPIPLDIFYSRLFGEILSQKGFKFHEDFNAGVVTANIIESVRKFRTIFINTANNPLNISREYLTMVKEGVISAQYIRSWKDEEEQAVLLSPAFTYLLRNKPVDYQFWLDISNESWYKRLYQPLTHPEVISRHWPSNQEWTQTDEDRYAMNSLSSLVNGLITRCNQRIYLGISERNEQGFETESIFLKKTHRVLQRITEREVTA